MNRQEFAQFFSSRGYRVVGWEGYGIENGYPVCVRLATKKCLALSFNLVPEDPKAFKQAAASVDRHYYLRYNKEDHCAEATIRTSKNDYSMEFHEGISVLTQFFRGQDYRPADSCPFCKQTGCDAFVRWNGKQHPIFESVHKACVYRENQNIQGQATHNQANGSYLKGIIGAFLGAIVGTIPATAVLLFANYLVGILFALIPMAIAYGYRKLGGKRNKLYFLIVILFSFLSIFWMESLMIIWQIVTYGGVSLAEALVIVPLALADPAMLSELLPELIQQGIFVLLGLWIAGKQVFTTAAGEAAMAADNFQTMLDNPSACPQVRE